MLCEGIILMNEEPSSPPKDSPPTPPDEQPSTPPDEDTSPNDDTPRAEKGKQPRAASASPEPFRGRALTYEADERVIYRPASMEDWRRCLR